MNTEELNRKIDLLRSLEKEYCEKYKDFQYIFPNEWYQIDIADFDTKIKLLKQALETDKMLKDLSYFENFKIAHTQAKLNKLLK